MDEKENGPYLPLPEADYSMFDASDGGVKWHVEAIGINQPLAAEATKPLLDLGLGRAVMVKHLDLETTRTGHHTRHTFFLLLDGMATLEINGQSYSLSPGDLIYYPPGTTVINRKSSRKWHIHINFDDTPVWEPMKQRGIYVRQYESADYLYLLFRRIADAVYSRRATELAFAREDAAHLANLLKREVVLAVGKKHRFNASFEHLVRQVRERPQAQWTLSSMAKQCHVSICTLNRLFAKEYGITPVDMVIRERMYRAQEILETTDDKVQSVAMQVGYESLSSFTRLYKKHIGRTPGECREVLHVD